MPTTQRFDALVTVLRSYGSTVVAFSGGVDSALVARAAHQALGNFAIAVISDSPTLGRDELANARQVAAEIGISFETIVRSELDDPHFVANGTDRCHFCKAGLQEELAGYAAKNGYATVSYGVNESDLGDWRPGIQAARERGGRFPLLEAGFDKAAIRDAARAIGLSVWDKPAAPCLSSRVPYGEVITVEKLGRVEKAERLVRALGFRELRVRSLAGVARVEVPASQVGRLADLRATVVPGLQALGFSEVILDTRGLQSGRLNQEHGGIPHV